jgi:hypothetical protein
MELTSPETGPTSPQAGFSAREMKKISPITAACFRYMDCFSFVHCAFFLVRDGKDNHKNKERVQINDFFRNPLRELHKTRYTSKKNVLQPIRDDILCAGWVCAWSRRQFLPEILYF